MANGNYIWVPQKFDCRGGINEEPENALPNQVLDARNVWCPDGRLQQRPGFVSVASPLLNSTNNSNSTELLFLKEDNSTGTSVYTALTYPAELDLSSLTSAISGGSRTEPDRFYFGHANDFEDDSLHTWRFYMSATNSNTVGVLYEYWNGVHWDVLPVLETRQLALARATIPFANTLTYLFLVPPADMAATTINSTEAYWIRGTFKDWVNSTPSAALDASVTLRNNAVNECDTFAIDDPLEGLFSFQFPSKKVYAWINRRSASGVEGNISFTLANNLPVVDGVQVGSTETNEFAINEPASSAVIPQFGEAYVGFDYTHFVVPSNVTDSVTYADLLPKVETNPVWVGEIGGVKADFHPDFVTQLGAWPDSNYVEFFDGQLWAAGFVDDYNRVRWSAPQPAYKVWPEESNELLMEDDNSPITGMKALGEQLAIFKQDSIWKMVHSGVGGVAGLNQYVPIKVPGGIGTVANNSIIDVNGTLMFLAEDGVYGFDGMNKPQKLSDPIDSVIASINPGRRRFSAGVHWRTENSYLLSVAINGSETNNAVLVFDYSHGGWWIWEDIGAEVWMRDEGPFDEERIYFGDSKGFIFELGVGDRDNGNAISSYVETHRTGLDYEGHVSAREVRLEGEKDNPDLTVEVSRDDEDSGVTRAITFQEAVEYYVGDTDATVGTATVNGEGRRRRKVTLRKTGDFVKTKVSNSTKGIGFRLGSIKTGLISKGVR